MIKKNEEIYISIIVPFFNTKWKLLKKCIDSIAEQERQYCEVILLNDCSTDRELADKCCAYVKDFSDFIVLENQKNSGVSFSRNQGIAQSRGRFLLFVDSDDWIESGMLHDLLQVVQKEDCDTVFYEYNRWIEDKKVSVYRKLDKKDYQMLNFNMMERMILSNDFNSPWCCLYAKEILDRNQIRFDCNTQLGEDFIFNVQYLKQYKKGRYLNKAYYNYRFNNASATNMFSTKKVEDTGKGYYTRKELLKEYVSGSRPYVIVEREFYSQYYRAILIHILNGLNSGSDKEEVFKCLEYGWVQDLISYRDGGFIVRCERALIKKRCRKLFLCISKVQKIKKQLYIGRK